MGLAWGSPQYIDRPSDFRSRSLNRRLTASCFVVSRIWLVGTHDACGSCRPKVCLCDVVELQKQETNSWKKLLGTGTRKAGQIWSQSTRKQLLWLVLDIKPKLARARSGSKYSETRWVRTWLSTYTRLLRSLRRLRTSPIGLFCPFFVLDKTYFV